MSTASLSIIDTNVCAALKHAYPLVMKNAEMAWLAAGIPRPRKTWKRLTLAENFESTLRANRVQHTT